MNNTNYKEIIDYQEHVRFVNWILKFLIIIAFTGIIILAGYFGFRHMVKTTTDAVSNTMEIIDDNYSNLIDDATMDPSEGVNDINTTIR